METHLKQLGKDSIIYGIGGTAAKALTVLLLPVLTRLFTPAEYGIIETLIVIAGLITVIMNMGMDTAQSFFFFEQKKQGKEAQSAVVSSIFLWRLISGISIITTATLLSPYINRFLFEGKITWSHFFFAFCGGFLTKLMFQSAELFRLSYRPWKYIIITLGTTVCSIVVAIILIVWLKLGILGYFLGFSIGPLCGAAVGWWMARGYLNWSSWHRKWWSRLLKFGSPLIFSGLAMYVMNSADRWFIIHCHGEEALGIYAVGAKFAMALFLIIEAFRMAWWPVALDAMHSPDGTALFRTVSRFYMGICSAGVVLLTAISPLLVSLLTTPAFHSAYIIVGILAWHSVFYGFMIICNSGIIKMEKTKLMPIFMFAAALLNITLNSLWVPKYGGVGAALATSLSFLVWNILTLIVSEKLWYVGYNKLLLLGQVTAGGMATAYISNLHTQGDSTGIIVIFTSISCVLLALSGLRTSDFQTIVKDTGESIN